MNQPVTVYPGLYPQEERRRRKEIAQFARAGQTRPDTSVPQCLTHCFLAEHVAWDPASKWQQHADTLYRNFQSWGQGHANAPKVDRESFDRHLTRWLLATALTFVIGPNTSRISHIHGLRMTSRQRTASERAAVIDVLADLDQTP